MKQILLPANYILQERTANGYIKEIKQRKQSEDVDTLSDINLALSQVCVITIQIYNDT